MKHEEFLLKIASEFPQIQAEEGTFSGLPHLPIKRSGVGVQTTTDVPLGLLFVPREGESGTWLVVALKLRMEKYLQLLGNVVYFNGQAAVEYKPEELTEDSLRNCFNLMIVNTTPVSYPYRGG